VASCVSRFSGTFLASAVDLVLDWSLSACSRCCPSSVGHWSWVPVTVGFGPVQWIPLVIAAVKTE